MTLMQWMCHVLVILWLEPQRSPLLPGRTRNQLAVEDMGGSLYACLRALMRARTVCLILHAQMQFRNLMSSRSGLRGPADRSVRFALLRASTRVACRGNTWLDLRSSRDAPTSSRPEFVEVALPGKHAV